MTSPHGSLEGTETNERLAVDISEADRVVTICVVPKSLICGKKEAFIPQFVGFGPYHHLRDDDLIVTKQRKSAAAKRVFKDNFHSDTQQLISDLKFDSHIQTLYHPDFKFTSDDHHHALCCVNRGNKHPEDLYQWATKNSETLYSLLALDGVFLFAFISIRTDYPHDAQFSNFLTGNLRMPLFNAAGVELTKSVLIRDIFMLENQIPYQVLEQIIEHIRPKKDLNSDVEKFCKDHCPVLGSEVPPPYENKVHLLDLMYHLIVPEPQSLSSTRPDEPQAQQDPLPEPEPDRGFAQYFPSMFGHGEWELLLIPLLFLVTIPYVVAAFVYLIFMPCLPDTQPQPQQDEPNGEPHPSELPESEPNGEPHPTELQESEPNGEPHPTELPESEPNGEPHPTDNGEPHPTELPQSEPNGEPDPTELPQSEPDSDFQLFGSWEDLGYVMVAELLLPGYFIYLIMKLFLWVICSLIIRPIKRVLSYLFGLVKRPFSRRNLNSTFRKANEALSSVDFQKLDSLKQAVASLVEITEDQQQSTIGSDEGGPLADKIPHAKRLLKAGISFQSIKTGISSIDFDAEKCIFYLPIIRLDVNSDVIIRNLVAYETLIKSNTPLVFTRYVELMRAIIDTHEDVKILVDAKIIQTELTNEAVAKLFNGMNNSIRPTKTQELDKVIYKVKAKVDSTRKGNWVILKRMSKTCFAVMGGLLLLAFTALQTYCSFFGCSRTSKLAQLPQDGEYYGRTNYFISSI